MLRANKVITTEVNDRKCVTCDLTCGGIIREGFLEEVVVEPESEKPK